MQWLISYRVTTVFYDMERHRTTEPRDVIGIIDTHPVNFAAKMRIDSAGPFPRPGETESRVDFLNIIHSAIRIPGDTLDPTLEEAFT